MFYSVIFFSGASALHLAIAYDNMDVVKSMVEAGANINQRATGKLQGHLQISRIFSSSPLFQQKMAAK